MLESYYKVRLWLEVRNQKKEVSGDINVGVGSKVCALRLRGLTPWVNLALTAMGTRFAKSQAAKAASRRKATRLF